MAMVHFGSRLILLLRITLTMQFELRSCDSSERYSTAYLCKVHDNYSNLDFPQPGPTFIQVGFRIQEVISVEEDHQVIELILKLAMRWNDTRISYAFNDDNKGRYVYCIRVNDICFHGEFNFDLFSYFPWVLLNNTYTSTLWRPNVHWSNSIKIEKLPSLNQNIIGSFWYRHPNHFLYQEYLKLSVSCDMKFENYPFDSHICYMQMTNIIGNLDLVVLQTPMIYSRDEKDNPDGKSYTTSNDKIEFDTVIKPMKSTYNLEFGYKYSKAEVEFTLKRKTSIVSYLSSSYFAPTSIFSALSLISYCIDPHNVPGRMALLITVCLIITNTYNSINVGPNIRGYSYIEVWYIGIVVPVFIGIIEYGTILCLMKFGNEVIKFNPKTLYQTLDILACAISAIALIGFNLLFWTGFQN